MEVSSLKSFKEVLNISRNGLVEKSFMFGRTISVATRTTNSKKRHANAIPRNLKVLECRAQASGITKVGSVEVETVSGDDNSKDGNLVFVAGATGRVGSRTVRELLKLGYKVRAGVRNMSRAESLVQVVRQMKLNDASNGGNQSIEKLQIVECDLEKPDQIGPALGKASIVICCIGASEKEIFDITGPYRIDYMATKNIIDAATIAKVDHFILLTSLGTNKFGLPAAILNLFWGVLCWKRKAEEALIASGLPYTIVRPGGMERPTDSYKLTHNITLSEEDTLFGGQVSNLQVAELMAFMAKNRCLSYCKVVEVIAETTAPLNPVGDLLAKIPSKRIEMDPPKESGDADEPSPSVSEIKTSDPSNPLIVKENSPALTMSLSPYTAYEDLKPPTTPSPTPSSKTGDFKANLETLLPVSDSLPPGVEYISFEASNIVNERGSLLKEVKHSSSPYPNYADLKPPSSPSPTPSGTKEESSGSFKMSDNAIQITEGINQANTGTSLVENDPPSSVSSNSPYQVYDDLKPPSSPTPNAPVISKYGAVESRQNPSVTQHESVSKQYTLSPFTMYEDLKPPSSPSPSWKEL